MALPVGTKFRATTTSRTTRKITSPSMRDDSVRLRSMRLGFCIAWHSFLSSIDMPLERFLAAHRLVWIGQIGGRKVASDDWRLAQNLIAPHRLRFLLFKGQARIQFFQQVCYIGAQFAVTFGDAGSLRQGSRVVARAIAV